MKKLIACLLAVLMLLSLSACAKTQTEDEGPFESKTLLDDEKFYFHIAAISEYDPTGCLLDLDVENRMDTDLLFSVTNASVNGCMIDPQLSESVGAGQSMESQMLFPHQQLQNYGIEDVTEIQFTLCIYDEQNNEDTLLNEVFTLYPHGKSAVTYQTRAAEDSDIILMDNESCTVIVTGKDPESFWGYDLYVYLINKTDKTLLFSASDVTVNGIDCDPYWSATVAPGKQSSTVVYWFDNTLADAQIEQIEQVVMTLSATDMQSWPDGTLASETVTFNP